MGTKTENIANGVLEEYELSKKHGLACLPIENILVAHLKKYMMKQLKKFQMKIQKAIEQANEIHDKKRY